MYRSTPVWRSLTVASKIGLKYPKSRCAPFRPTRWAPIPDSARPTLSEFSRRICSIKLLPIFPSCLDASHWLFLKMFIVKIIHRSLVKITVYLKVDKLCRWLEISSMASWMQLTTQLLNAAIKNTRYNIVNIIIELFHKVFHQNHISERSTALKWIFRTSVF